jgi:hypothetical protein
MNLAMKVNIIRAESKEKAFFHGLMEAFLLVSLRIMIFMAMGSINGLMGEFLKGRGLKTRWVAMEFLTGLMVEDMKGTILMIKSMVMVILDGLMAEFTREPGWMEDNMAKEYMWLLKARREKDFGIPAKEKNG